MGPNDPFEPGLASPDDMLLDPPETEWRPPQLPSGLPAVARIKGLGAGQLGFSIGVAFGLLTLLTGLRDSLMVLAFGLVGAALFLGVAALRQLLPDLRVAWAAVLESRGGQTPGAGG